MRAPLREYSHCFHYCVGFKNSHVKWNNHLKIDSSLWVRFVYISIVIYTIRFPRRHLIYSDDDREVGLLQTESAACVFVCMFTRSRHHYRKATETLYLLEEAPIRLQMLIHS